MSVFSFSLKITIINNMDEKRAEEKKKKTIRSRRIGLEIRFFMAVTLLYMLIYLFLSIIPWFIGLFVNISSYIILATGMGLAVLTYVLTSVIASSHGFAAFVCGRYK